MNDGVNFFWKNQKQMYKNRTSSSQSPSLKAYIDKLNTEYIATRPRRRLRGKF